jgi:hypothetical protein
MSDDSSEMASIEEFVLGKGEQHMGVGAYEKVGGDNLDGRAAERRSLSRGVRGHAPLGKFCIYPNVKVPF